MLPSTEVVFGFRRRSAEMSGAGVWTLSNLLIPMAPPQDHWPPSDAAAWSPEATMDLSGPDASDVHHLCA